MAFEALNNAGASDADLLVILNDNEMSISEPVGALNSYLARLLSSRLYNTMRRGGKEVLSKLPPVQGAREARRGAPQGHGAPGHAVRGIRLQLHRPDRRPRRRRRWRARSPTCASSRGRSCCTSSRARAYGYARAEDDPILYHGVTRVRPGSRHRAESCGEALVHADLRRLAGRHGRARSRASSGSRRRCAKAPGSCASRRNFPSAISTSASPSSTPSPSPPGSPAKA